MLVKTLLMPEMADVINRHIHMFLCSSRYILCLQVEPSDDSSGNDVPVIMSNSCDDIISSGMDDIKQVNDFLSYQTVLLLNLLYLHNSWISVLSQDARVSCTKYTLEIATWLIYCFKHL